MGKQANYKNQSSIEFEQFLTWYCSYLKNEACGPQKSRASRRLPMRVERTISTQEFVSSTMDTLDRSRHTLHHREHTQESVKKEAVRRPSVRRASPTMDVPVSTTMEMPSFLPMAPVRSN